MQNLLLASSKEGLEDYVSAKAKKHVMLSKSTMWNFQLAKTFSQLVMKKLISFQIMIKYIKYIKLSVIWYYTLLFMVLGDYCLLYKECFIFYLLLILIQLMTTARASL